MQDGPRREQSNTSGIGKAMTFAAWIVVLGIGTLLFDRYLDQQHNPNQSVYTANVDGVKEIVLQRNRLGHYVSSGRIAGAKVRFLMDTGATTVSIPEQMARQLGLERGPEARVMTANGEIPVYMTRLPSVQIGDIVLQDVRAHINPWMDGEDVLLGMSFLKHLEFTQRGDQLILRQYRQGGSL